jgi:hypothetical protein
VLGELEQRARAFDVHILEVAFRRLRFVLRGGEVDDHVVTAQRVCKALALRESRNDGHDAEPLQRCETPALRLVVHGRGDRDAMTGAQADLREVRADEARCSRDEQAGEPFRHRGLRRCEGV